MAPRSLEEIMRTATPVEDDAAAPPAARGPRSLEEIMRTAKPVLDDERRAELQAKVDETSQYALDNDESTKINILETILGATRGAARGYTGHANELLPQAQSWEQTQKAAPAASFLGEMVGGAVSPLGRIFGVGGEAATVGQLARQGALNGAAQGAIEGGFDAAARGEAEAGDLVPGIAGGIVGGVLPGVGAAARKLGPKVVELGQDAGNFLLGGSREIADMAKAHGFDNVTDSMYRALQKYSPAGFFGKGVRGHLDEINNQVDWHGANLGQLRREVDQHLVQPSAGAGELMPAVPGDVDMARQKLIEGLSSSADAVASTAADAGSRNKANAMRVIAEAYKDKPAKYSSGSSGRVVGRDLEPGDLTQDAAAQAQDLLAGMDAMGINPSIRAGGTAGRSGPVVGAAHELDYLPGDTEAKAQALLDRLNQTGFNPLIREGGAAGTPGREVGRAFEVDDLTADARSSEAAMLQELMALGLNPAVRAGGTAGRMVEAPTKGLRFDNFEQLGKAKSVYQSFARPNGQESVSDEASKQAAAAAGSILREAEDTLVQKAPEPIQQAFGAEKERYGELATLKALLEKRLPSELSGGDIAGIVGTGLAEGAVGALPGMLIGNDDLGMLGGTAGLVHGLGFGGGATRSAARQMFGRRATEVGANTLQAVGQGLSRFGDAATSAAPYAVGGALAGKSMMPGHTQTDRVAQLLILDPAGLGQYQQALQQAQQEGRLASEVNKLAEVDTNFREMLNR